MNFHHYLAELFCARRPRPKTQRRRKMAPRRLWLEQLEDRCVPAVFTVNSLLDTVDANPGDGQAADAGGFTSLRAAIMEANATAGADQIALPAGTYHLTLAGADEDLAASGDLDTTDFLTITGTGAASTTIDASTIPGGDRVFDIHGANNVNLAGLTITGGNPEELGSEGFGEFGAGILNREATLTVSECTIAGNTAESNGGGIFNGHPDGSPGPGTLELTGSTVSGNHTGDRGGGGGIFNYGLATVTACRITGNTAALGAGIWNSGTDPDLFPEAGQLTLTGSTVSDNTASDAGGGIFISIGDQTTVIQSTISGNLAQFGAGIEVVEAPLTVVNSTISANGSNYLPGQSGTRGGGIDNGFGSSTISLDHVTLSHNIANFGAGIENFDLPGDGNSFTIQNSIIADNAGAFLAFADSNGNYFSNTHTPPTSLGHNLDSDGTCHIGAPGDLSLVDPLLGPLADNGGFTQTRKLLAGSPAIDAGDAVDATLTDGRGFRRPADGNGDGFAVSDIGAYESKADVIIDATTPQDFLDTLTVIEGSLIMKDVCGRTDLLLPNLTEVDGDFIVTGNCDLATLSAPTLTTIGGKEDLSNNPALTTVNMGSLATVDGSFNVAGDISTVDLGSLTTVTGNFNVAGDISTVDLGSLSTVTGSFNVAGDISTVDVGSLTTVTGNLNVAGDISTVDVGSLTTVTGNFNIAGDISTVDLGSLSTVTGSFNIAGDTSTIDASSLTTVGGDETLEAKNSITAVTADGSTEVTLFSTEAQMTAALATGTFTNPVPFMVTRLDPAALPPEPGLDFSGGPATIDPLAAYNFNFAIPTLGQLATLTFDINVAALGADDQADFLTALAAGNATVAVKNDDLGSVFQAFAIAAPGQPPDATHVTMVRLDASGNPLPDGSSDTPAVVRFEGVTGHFSNFAVVIVSHTSDNSPPIARDDVAALDTSTSASVNINVLANDFDLNGDALTITAVTQPASGHGKVTINADGTLTYTQTVFVNGTGTFTYTISDGHGGTATATVTVTVNLPARVGIDMLIGQVKSSSLNQGQQTSLIAKLNAAKRSLAQGNVQAAANQLGAFANQVRALLHAGILTPDLADLWLLEDANILDAIG